MFRRFLGTVPLAPTRAIFRASACESRTSSVAEEQCPCGFVAPKSVPFVTPASVVAEKRSPETDESARSVSAASMIRNILAVTANSAPTRRCGS